MAIEMLSPGVQVEVQDHSWYTRPETYAEAQVGIVGGALKGPLGPVLITNRDQALRVFGNPSTNDYGILSLLYCLTRCNAVYYSRVVKDASKATAGNELVDRILFSTIEETSRYNGTRIEILPSDFTSEWITDPLPADDPDSPSFEDNVTKYEVDLTTVAEADYKDFFDIRITLLTGEIEYIDFCTLDTVVDRVANESRIVEVILNPDTSTQIRYAISVTFELEGGSIGGSVGYTQPREDIMFYTRNYDSTVEGWTVTISELSFLNTVDYILRDADGNVMERLYDLSLDPDSDTYIETMINNGSFYVTCSIDENLIDFNELHDETFTFRAGTSGMDGIAEEDIIRVLDDFSNPETLEVDLIITPSWSSTSVIKKAISICEGRQDCMYLVDPPFGLTPREVTDWCNATGIYRRSGYDMLNSSYAAVYWPWLQVYDDISKTYIWMPPSTVVATQIVYSDSISFPWYAPAGINRGMIVNVAAVEMSPSQAERDLLYGGNNAVNPIVNFRNTGIVIWGQKTTLRAVNGGKTTSALNRVNVRRLTNYLKRLIQNLSRNFIFDPNDQNTRQKWISMVNNEMTTVQSRNGIYEFNVSVNVTVDDYEQHRMPGIVRYKPTKSAEFIPITFMIMAYSDSL